MQKRSRGYSNDGYGSGNGDRTARGQVGWQRCVNDDDFIDGNKDDNQQEIKTKEDGWDPPYRCDAAQGSGELVEDRHKCLTNTKNGSKKLKRFCRSIYCF